MNEFLFVRVKLVVEWSIERENSPRRVYIKLNAVKVNA